MTHSVTDLRSPKRRAQRQAAPAGDTEGLAARVMAYTVNGHVIVQDDGSAHSMVDLRLEYPDGRPSGFAEVVADMDAGYGQMWNRTIRAPTTPLPALNRVWCIVVAPGCRTIDLREALPELLSELTSKGLTFDEPAEVDHLRRLSDRTVIALVEAGVVGIDSRPVRADEQAHAYLAPPSITGPMEIDWTPVLSWLDDILVSASLADVRSKLAATEAPERHAVIVVTYSSPGDVVFALSRVHKSLPPRAPALPEEITHLWLLGTLGMDRNLVWYPEFGWFDSQNRVGSHAR